jgi:hypothetical protein
MIEIEEENIGDPINVLENHRIRNVSADLHEQSQIMLRFTRWPFTRESAI